MLLRVQRNAGVWIASLLFSTVALVANMAGATEALPKCCVWRVTNAKAPFYLVGSVHALDRNDYPLPRPYELALKDARRLLFEFNPNRAAEFDKKFAAAGKYPPGQDIRSKIDPKLLAWLRENVSPVNVDHNRLTKSRPRVADFDGSLGYKPWWIAQHLVDTRNSSNMSTSHGLDDYLVGRARKTGQEIDGLESVDEHVAVLGGLPDRDSEFLLRDALNQSKSGAVEFTRMRSAWRKGDTAALWAGDAHLRKEAPQIAARFVDQRNIKWIPRIEAELKTGKPTAIVAGALHFSGPNSVIALLQKRGYKIEQL
jgi:Uncharacterized protein conserved in bacteria